MKKVLILVLLLMVTYVGLSLILHLNYGDSSPFLQGEDCWLPDGNGGWIQHGQPVSDMPVEASVNIPELVKYIPIFVPALILMLFYFTPLSRKLESEPDETDSTEEESEKE